MTVESLFLISSALVKNVALVQYVKQHRVGSHGEDLSDFRANTKHPVEYDQDQLVDQEGHQKRNNEPWDHARVECRCVEYENLVKQECKDQRNAIPCRVRILGMYIELGEQYAEHTIANQGVDNACQGIFYKLYHASTMVSVFGQRG